MQQHVILTVARLINYYYSLVRVWCFLLVLLFPSLLSFFLVVLQQCVFCDLIDITLLLSLLLMLLVSVVIFHASKWCLLIVFFYSIIIFYYDDDRF